MKRVLFIIAPLNFNDAELEMPKEILEDAGMICDVASLTSGPAKGMNGLMTKPDFVVDKVDIENYAGVVVVGGSGSPVLSKNEKILSILQKAVTLKKIIGAICLGSLTLLKAGILTGKKGTGWKCPEMMQTFSSGGGQFVDQGVVLDGYIVTAQGPQFAEEFGKKLLELLKK